MPVTRTRSPDAAEHAEGGPVALMAAILRGAPRLEGAACIGQHAVVDPALFTDRSAGWQARSKAARQELGRLCATCPCRTRCPYAQIAQSSESR